MNAIRRKNWQPTNSSYVCSDRFVRHKKSDDELSPDFIPSVFRVGDRENGEKVFVARERRKNREVARQLDTRTAVSIEDDDEVEADGANEPRPEGAASGFCSVSCQTSLSLSDLQGCYTRLEFFEQRRRELEAQNKGLLKSVSSLSVKLDRVEKENAQLRDDVDQLREENERLEGENTQRNQSFEKSLEVDDGKVKFYSGLPSFAVLMAVFKFASADISSRHRAGPTSFVQFLIVLIKLRLNLTDRDLAYRFGVSQSSISKYFGKWIHILYIRMKHLIVWPQRAELHRTMPLEFRKRFSKCVCTIDCFKVFCERPSDLMARAQTYSNYKSHNTAKFLIGISPQGVITFISAAWGGRASDKYITEHCGILDKLLPGDQIMADRGFTVGDSVGLHCAELVIPPFTRGKKQLSRVVLESSGSKSQC